MSWQSNMQDKGCRFAEVCLWDHGTLEGYFKRNPDGLTEPEMKFVRRGFNQYKADCRQGVPESKSPIDVREFVTNLESKVA